MCAATPHLKLADPDAVHDLEHTDPSASFRTVLSTTDRQKLLLTTVNVMTTTHVWGKAVVEDPNAMLSSNSQLLTFWNIWKRSYSGKTARLT